MWGGRGEVTNPSTRRGEYGVAVHPMQRSKDGIVANFFAHRLHGRLGQVRGWVDPEYLPNSLTLTHSRGCSPSTLLFLLLRSILSVPRLQFCFHSLHHLLLPSFACHFLILPHPPVPPTAFRLSRHSLRPSFRLHRNRLPSLLRL